MKNPIQEKKDYLISLLKKYWEYDKKVDRKNLNKKDLDRIYKVLITTDENKRNELINAYKEEEMKEMKEKRRKAEELLIKVKKLSNQIKEAKWKLNDEKDIEDLEKAISTLN